MSDWPKVSLGEIFEIARGGSPRPIRKYITNDSSGINWIMIGDAIENSKYIHKTKKRIHKSGVTKSRMVYKDDFLLSNSMSFGRPYILKTGGCIHDGWLVLRKKGDYIDNNFFFHLLGSNTIYKEFKKRASGAVVKNLNIDLVKSVQIVLPPLPEQKRIAAILDKADALREKRRQAIARLDELLQSVFLDMFGDPATNPKGWDKVSLNHVLNSIDSGWSPKCEAWSADTNDWGVLKLGSVTWCVFKQEENKALPKGLIGRPQIEIKKGDLLFTRKNTYELVAASAYVWEVKPKLMLSDLIFRLNLNKKSGILPIFLWQQLTNSSLRKRIQNLAGGAAGSMPNISKAKLKTVRIIKPQMEAQLVFNSIVENNHRIYLKYQDQANKLDTLFSSLQQRAFKGEL